MAEIQPFMEVVAVWLYGVDGELFYRTGEKNVVSIIEKYICPEPFCSKPYYEVRFADGTTREMHQFTTVDKKPLEIKK